MQTLKYISVITFKGNNVTPIERGFAEPCGRKLCEVPYLHKGASQSLHGGFMESLQVLGEIWETLIGFAKPIGT